MGTETPHHPPPDGPDPMAGCSRRKFLCSGRDLHPHLSVLETAASLLGYRSVLGRQGIAPCRKIDKTSLIT